jgi:hypothetical protein
MLGIIEALPFGVALISSRGDDVDQLMEHGPALCEFSSAVGEAEGAHSDVGIRKILPRADLGISASSPIATSDECQDITSTAGTASSLS